jgi:hypothetical protein
MMEASDDRRTTMKTIQMTGKTGPDGVLHVNVPIGTAETEFDVVVILQPKQTPTTDSPESRGWPPGFFEKTAGSITDPTFRRHEQGEFEKRLDFE